MAVSSLQNKMPKAPAADTAAFRFVLGNDRAKHQLLSAVQNKEVSHAYIFEGAAGFGKHNLAAAFVKTLFCEAVREGRSKDACLTCPSCRLLYSGNHPDVKWITLGSSGSEDAKSIGTDRIRDEVVRDMAILPYRSDRKVYIIEQAEKMTVSAQNALLKTIEEPPYYGHIILLTQAASSLLPTILSRCVRIKLDPLPEDVMVKALTDHGISEDEAVSLALASSGSLGMALLLSREEAFGELRKELFSFLASIASLSKLEVIRKEALFSAPSTNRDWLFMLLTLWYRDLLVLKTARDASLVLCQDHIDDLTALLNYYSTEHLLRILQTIRQTEDALSSSANALLAMDVLLMTLVRQ